MTRGVRARFLFDRREVRGADAPLASATKDGVSLRSEAENAVWNPGDDVSLYKLVEPDDFVIGLRSFQHGIARSRVHGLVSPAYTVLRARTPHVIPGFFGYYFRSAPLIAALDNLSQGIRQGRAIPYEPFSDLRFPVPAVEDQLRIADFLDTQVASLDRVIFLRDQQNRLALESAAARLTSRYMEDIERFGAIRLGLLLDGLEQGWSPQCEDRPTSSGEFGVLKAGCVNGGSFRPAEHKALPPATTPRLEYLVRAGDLLMSRASGSLDLIGSAAVIPPNAPANLLLCDKVYRLSAGGRADATFIALMLRSRPVREAIKLGTSGAEGMANNLPSSTVRGLHIPAAPLDHQRAVTAEILSLDKQHEQAQRNLKRSLDLLEERKRALITAAVTGQFDVTTARAVA